MFRAPAILLFALPLLGDCRLPDVAPNAIDRLSPEDLVDSGHYLRVVRVLEPVVRQSPDNIQAAVLLSSAKAALGDYDSALTLAEAALRSDKLNAAYHVHAAAVLGQAAQKASLLKQLTYARRARQELDEAIALEPNNVEAQWGLMMYYFAAPALIGGDKAKAQALGRQLAATVPDLGRYYQGRLAMEMKDPDAAEAFYRQAIGENPLLFEPVARLAGLYMDQKPNPFLAEQWACVAVHLDSTRGDAWALLAKAYSLSGCWTEAISVAERAEAIDPDNLVPWYAIAATAIKQHRQTEMAAEFLRKYISRPIEGKQPTAEEAQSMLDRLH